ncbi:GNAT family N-acetyltransferase [Xenorhabdus bovienii]|nr:GNAT family N-acetyltransferase [Xenorhabdus bovienii]MDE9459991.1 GNAT family N-acetyltransferase [Xenorhabdus bovienii]MDE9469230.1 GNAT family N-acetyltransferase [Xenorhabdus bovienii]MDE9485831.1 GNAT family N-acetyltransferase [Xenorhabdus bovienii]MDE9563614.1 GNAT family N-acetyltransferase [Xenorhabdus bovienii]
MIIRAAFVQDIDAILSLYNVLFSEMAELQPDRLKGSEQDRNLIISYIDNNKFHLLVAEDDNGDIKGFSIAQEQNTPPFNCLISRTYGYIFDLIVSQDARSQGIGQRLLAGMKKWAQKNNYSHLELTVLSQNVEAIRFYEKEGYNEINKLMAITL